MTDKKPNKCVAVIGAGPVGCLTAIYLVKHGWNVRVYEKRLDERKIPAEQRKWFTDRSINFTLSERGIQGLKKSGIPDLWERVVAESVPMHSRMLHNGRKLESVPYTRDKKCTYSINRSKLNDILLETLERFHQQMTVYFGHQLLRCDLDAGTLVFETKQEENTVFVQAEADWIIGADGVGSVVRSELNRKTKMTLTQKYYPHLYCELLIPPQKLPDGTCRYAMDPSHVHLWPRQSMLLLSLANKHDFSFTCTLWMDEKKFEAIQTPQALTQLFKEYFPDALDLIGQTSLHQQFFKNPKGHMASIQCTPYHYKDKCLIIGDAAHAMVNFYAQGLNCGFQDVTVFFDLLNRYGADLESVFETYSAYRYPDAVAISELSEYNYLEMRSLVQSPFYRIRKLVERWCFEHHLFGIVPLYDMVTFSDTRYSVAKQKWIRQGYMFNAIWWWILVFFSICLAYFLSAWNSPSQLYIQ